MAEIAVKHIIYIAILQLFPLEIFVFGMKICNTFFLADLAFHLEMKNYRLNQQGTVNFSKHI